jgi:hypothetical protein
MRRPPSNPPRGDTPAQAREALGRASALVSQLTSRLAVIHMELKDLLASHASVDPPVVAKSAERGEVRSKLTTARFDESKARDHLQQTIAVWWSFGAVDEITQLSAEWPIVLFPVRIETRFDLSSPSPSLLVRIYPDDISIDTHEPLLTDAEAAAGLDYWTFAATAGEQEAWRRLLVTYPSTRAAWIVRSTTPLDAMDDGDFHLFLPLRSSSWTRPAIALGMPDRFRVAAYRGERRVAFAIGNTIVEPLAVSLDPSADPDDPKAFVDVSGHGLEIDRAIAWTVDFEAAVKAGMAVRIPLDAEDAAKGFDQLFVVGVKTSLKPVEGAAGVASLLEAQHYTAGWGFVRQGTPTHNTSDSRSPFPASDPGGVHSFPIERGTSASPPDGSGVILWTSFRSPGSNGVVLANALGIGEVFTDHVENTELLEQPHAKAFNDALWPGTLGYYMRQMLDPFVTEGSTEALRVARPSSIESIDSETRAHFVNYVRGVASLPSLRVGRKVYGVLPVTSLARWKPDAEARGVDRALPALLTTLRGIWSSTLNAVPHIGRSADTEADLISTLGMEARSRRVRVAQMLGPTAHFNLLSFLRMSPESWENERQGVAGDAMSAIGHPGWDPLIGWMSFSRTADLFLGALVADALSEEKGLDPNYILSIRTASVDALRLEVFPASSSARLSPVPIAPRSPGSITPAAPTALLYHVLRYAALTEYDRLASLLVINHDTATPLLRPDEELVGFGRSQSIAIASSVSGSRPTAWERLNRTIAFTGTQTIAEYLLDPARDTDGGGAHAYRQSLAAIEDLSTAELERLFTSTLDTCSHRLDAWITSLASKRLASMRTRNPSGAHWGAYGWIENLRPAGEQKTETLADGRVGIVQTSSDGYVHSPTMTHASAAAALRSAYRARSGGDSERYGIDLSSDRVRRALRLLEKVRSGESLGSALGHQFERGLRDRAAPQLPAVVDSLRRQYPLVANKLADSHLSADRVAARNVVDGLRLADAFRGSSLSFDASVLPAGSGARSAVESELREIEDTIDAISDLFTAESVFQSMRGNIAATAASLDAIAGGMRPPELECVQQPRGGTALTHRFAIVLGDGAVAAPLWTAPSSPRSTAEPRLDGWIGSLLGDPATIRCRATFPDPSLTGATAELHISLAALQLRPIDFFAFAIDAAENAEGISDLDILITRAAGVPSATIDNAPWPDRTIRTFADGIETVRAIQALIAASRPLRAEDLVAPENAQKPRPSAVTISTRAAAARTTLDNLSLELVANSTSGFDPALLDASLVKASLFGIRGALGLSPVLFPGVAGELAERARNVLGEIASRLNDSARVGNSDDQIVRAVLGAGFVLLPTFTPTRPAELAQALAYAPDLVGNDPLAVPHWIRKAAPVRDPIATFRSMSLRANAAGGAAAPFAVVQLPFAAGAAWAALPFADEAHRPPAGRVSIVVQSVASPAATGDWAGLLVDEWSEIIPSASEQTAVSLQYEHPRAEAPQAVLVAVPPVSGGVWDFESLLDCVRETLHLAKVRGADLETLGAIGQIVPALCLASNAAGDAISAPLSSMLEEPPKVKDVQT